MSNIIIKDGGGSGKAAKVDNKQRLTVAGEARTSFQEAVLNGNGYILSSGKLTLTSATNSAILYFKNNGDKTIVMNESRYFIGNSTGGSGNFEISGVINPTGGTVITSAATLSGNLNLGSGNTLTLDARIGGEGITCTGTTGPTSVIATSQVIFVPINLAIPKGSSLCLQLKPPAGNTSVDIAIDVTLFELQD